MYTSAELLARIGRFPRVALIQRPTPIEEWPRLSGRLGRRILAKREDLTGFALGGNKSRMFEYLLADAVRLGADTVVAGAGAQSNYCRQLVAAANRLGLKTVLVLRTVRGAIDFEVQGNLLLDVLAGAKVRITSARGGQLWPLLDEAAEDVRRAGGRPYLPQREKHLGVIAYVECGAELYGQLDGTALPRAVYLAAAGETQAGLVLAMTALGAPAAIIGVNPGATWFDVRAHLADLVNEAAGRLDLDVAVTREDLVNTDEYSGPGYGFPTEASVEAIRLLARLEGVFLDPVYSSKAMAAVIADCESGRIPPGETVLFVHTGGVPALFHYREALGLPGVLAETVVESVGSAGTATGETARAND
jgi:D-cysteine desulfhydrase family pyridoxal phosphate-dependent enzyme